MAAAPTPRQRAAAAAGTRYWEAGPRRPRPTRDAASRELRFADFPAFRPNRTPAEVLRAGAFGGTYFRPIRSAITRKAYPATVHAELPDSWLRGVDIARCIVSERYRVEVNKYGVKSGEGLDFWETKGWMRPCDPYGWFQWYCRFYLGRRTDDDARQVGRWVRAVGPSGRWRSFLVGQCVRRGLAWDDAAASPVTRQTLLHWGVELTRAEFARLAAPIRRGKSVIYLGAVAPAKRKRGAAAAAQRRGAAVAAGAKRRRRA